jgi:hypothetical protein
MSDCAICIEPIKGHRKAAACPYCDVVACVKCTQKYLLSSHEDPHCMSCRKGWGRDVMTGLGKTWLNGEYKKHRENILQDREKSRLPAAQIILERYREADTLMPEYDAITDRIKELDKERYDLEVKYNILRHRITILRAGGSINTQETTEKRVFVMPCPAGGCRGFLSQAYKCGVCEIYACSECREIKNGRDDATHVCNPDTVATIRALKKETKPCPDCGANIFRIEGCNQMFCTACNTPFDWVSGKKVTSGAIHNPHYFEYIKTLNGGIMPRNPGDIPCGDNLPGPWRFETIMRRRDINGQPPEWLMKILRLVYHIREVEIGRATNHADAQDNTEENVRFLKGEITEARWKQLLQMREKRRMRRDDIRHRLEAFVGICTDIYGNLIQQADNKKLSKNEYEQLVADAVVQVEKVIDIYNTGVSEVGKLYGCCVKIIDSETFKMISKRITKLKNDVDILSVGEHTPRQNTLVRQDVGEIDQELHYKVQAAIVDKNIDDYNNNPKDLLDDHDS